MHHALIHTRTAEFWGGVRATIPLVIGAIPFGIIFGALAVNSGLSAGATAAMSAFVFAGSSQFIAAGLFGGGAGVLIIILTTFVVNLRHSLYSVTLAPHMKHLPQRWLAPLELRGVIEEIADDLLSWPQWPILEVLPDDPAERAAAAYWLDRYPEN